MVPTAYADPLVWQTSTATFVAGDSVALLDINVWVHHNNDLLVVDIDNVVVMPVNN